MCVHACGGGITEVVVNSTTTLPTHTHYKHPCFNAGLAVFTAAVRMAGVGYGMGAL